MADTQIQLSPAELMQQASQMQSIFEQYNTAFNEIENTLKNVNSALSPNIAHNFLNKITSARRTFDRVLEFVQGGAYAAQAAARTFQDVDNVIASVLRGGTGGIAETAISSMPNIPLSPQVIASLPAEKAVDIIDSVLDDDYTDLIDSIGDGVTKGLKNQLSNIIKDHTGMNIDIDSVTSKLKNGDVTGSMLDIAGAGVDAYNKLTGGVTVEGFLLDDLVNVAKIVTDPDSYANERGMEYAEGVLDSVDNCDPMNVVANVVGYAADVGVTTVVDGTCQSISHTIDNLSKSTVGVSLSEFNKMLEKTVGVNPGKVFNEVTGQIGDAYHKAISGITKDGTLKKVVTGVVNSAASGISNIFKTIF